MGIDRRGFLKGGVIVTAGVSLALSRVLRKRVRADIYGPLRPDPNGILDLPEGFSYRILETALTDRMDDGYRVPGRPDGMACMTTADGNLALMRNHEISIGDFANGPFDFGVSPPAESYHRAAPGGVTRLVVDPRTGERISSNLVLVGTARNCAGGPTPWGWMTCEENVSRTHGYVFLCDPNADRVQMPRKIPSFGRCYREAVAVDPSTSITYLTEDRSDSCFYRFVPSDPSRPFDGQLQALRVTSGDRFNLGRGLNVGDRLSVDWVNVDVPESPEPGDILRDTAQSAGAAILKRGEGIWFHDGSVYICSTSGGPIDRGQIFRLDVSTNELILLTQSTDRDLLDMPDNITVAWNGDVYMAEDGGGTNYVRILTPDGEVCDFARESGVSEFCGVCFSPDHRFLFMNLQEQGLTVVISGPFDLPDPPTEPDAGVPDAGIPDGSIADSGPDASIPDGNLMSDGAPDAGMIPTTGDGCGCSVPGQPTDDNSLLVAAGVGAAAYLSTRRGQSKDTTNHESETDPLTRDKESTPEDSKTGGN